MTFYRRMMLPKDATRLSPFDPLKAVSDWNFLCDHVFDSEEQCTFCKVRIPHEERPE